MKSILFLTALLCRSAQADIAVNIYSFDYDRKLIGSFTMPSSSYSPELSLGGPAKDWHPFGLTGFFAELHGSFTVATPGTGSFSLSGPSGLYSGVSFSIDGLDSFMGTGTQDWPRSRSITIDTPGLYNWNMTYAPQVAQIDDGSIEPTGRSWIELTDFDHVWGPAISVPEPSAWRLWILSAGLLLLWIDCRRRSSHQCRAKAPCQTLEM